MNTKIKEKDIIQESPPVVEELSASTRTVEVLSSQDSVVSDLVKESPSIEDMERAVSVNTLELPNILDLPEECKPLYKVKYRYRWLAKDKDLEAKLRAGIWALCTRSNSPYIKPNRFKSHGAVEQSGMLLAFCSEAAGQAREQAPAKRSADLIKHYTEDLAKQGDPKLGGFYTPDPDDGESDDGIEMD